jgi:hypothetical protein
MIRSTCHPSSTGSARPRLAGWALLIGLATGCLAAHAAKEAAADVDARYQRERSACVDGRSGQARETCLREAAAARVQARTEGLDTAPQDYESNATRRCAALGDEDRTACLARMQGQGTASGSVAGGGIYRELITREPAIGVQAPRPAQPMPAARPTSGPGTSER